MKYLINLYRAPNGRDVCTVHDVPHTTIQAARAEAEDEIAAGEHYVGTLTDQGLIDLFDGEGD